MLTNSSRETAVRHLERAGLRDRFERVMGSDQINAYKPDRRAYAYALEQCDAAAADTWLVAAHDWDVIGARGAGLRTAYLRRGGPGPVTIAVDREAGALGSLDL